MTPTPTTDSAVSPVSDERLREILAMPDDAVPARLARSAITELLSRRSLDTAGVERNADIEKIAWNCSEWPKWLGDAVERAMAVSDDLDMSTEQVLAYAILAALQLNKKG